LSGVQFLLEPPPLPVDAAPQAALREDAVEVAAFFKHKQQEEEGHARWAQSDLDVMHRVFGTKSAGVPNSMMRMVEFLGDVAQHAPLHYLGYILFAEHATVQAGAAWVQALEDHCGVPSSALSSIAKHVELDQFHVAEAKEEVNHLLRHVTNSGPFVRTLHGAMSHFEAFCDELNLSVEQRSIRPSRSEGLRA